MQLEIFESVFTDDRESSYYYLCQIRGLLFNRDGNVFSVKHSIIDIVSIDTLENYIAYLECLNGKILYRVVLFGKIVLTPNRIY